MAELNITIKRQSGGAGPSPASSAGASGLDPNSIKRVTDLLERQTRLLVGLAGGAKTFGAEFKKVEEGFKRLDDASARQTRLLAAMAGGARAFGTEFKKVEDGFKRLNETSERLTDAVKQSGKAMQDSFSAAAAGSTRVVVNLSRTIETQLTQSARRAGTALRDALRGVGAGVGSAVSGIGGAIGPAGQALFSGNPLGGAFRATGILGGAAVRGGGDIVGGALEGIPLVGGALGGGVRAAAGAAGGVLTAATELGAAIADKLVDAIKIGLLGAGAAAIGSLLAFSKQEAVSPSFEKLAKITGNTLPEALGVLREATKGTISDTNLMVQANRAAALGAASSVEEFAKLAEVARFLGRTVGLDAGAALESLALGIGRESKLILDNLGITVDLEKVMSKYAATLGRTSESLTDLERRTALVNEVFAQYQARSKGLDKDALTTADFLDRLSASFSNLAANVGRQLAPVFGELLQSLQPIIDAISRLAERLAGGVAEQIRQVVSGLSAWGNQVREIIDGLRLEDLPQLFETLWDGIWETFKEKGASAIQYLFDIVGQAANKVGGTIGDAVGSFASGISTTIGGIAASVGGGAPGRGFSRFSAFLSGAQERGQARSNMVVPGELLINQAAIEGRVGNLGAANPFNMAGPVPGGSGMSALQQLAAVLNNPEFSKLNPEQIGNFIEAMKAAGAKDADYLAVAEQLMSQQAQSPALKAAKALEESAKANLEGAQKALDAAEERATSLARKREEVDKKIADAEERRNKALEEINKRADESRKRAQELYDEQLRGIERAIQAAIRTRQQTLIGLAGGTEADSEQSLPPAYRRAARKLRRRAALERRQALRNMPGGGDAEALAADGGAQFFENLRRQAEAETDKFSIAHQIQVQAQEALTAALEKIAQEQEQAAEEIEAAAKKTVDALKELGADYNYLFSEVKYSQNVMTQTVRDIQKQLLDIERFMRSLR